MRRRLQAILLALIAAPAAAGDVDLDRWVDQELIPFVTTQLLEHPRFSGETLMFVVFDDNKPSALSNTLALSLRDRLLDAALDTGGIRIGWQQGGATALSAPALDCTRGDVHYYIGLQFARRIDDSYEVSVRALDLEDGSWVGGFGKSWRGRLNPSQQRAAKRRGADIAFIGSRDVPFTADQTDLLAEQLAYKLACDLLRQTSGEYLVPSRSRDGTDDSLQAAADLIANNIAAHSAFEMTSDEDHVNAHLAVTAHRIDGALHQYWLTVTPNGANEDLSTLSASAYVLRPDVRLAGERPTPAPPPDVATRKTVAQSRVASAAISVPNAGGDGLIAPLRVVTPTSVDHCQSRRVFLTTSTRWSREGRCSLLETRAREDAVVFFLEHQPQLGLVRLGGDDCRDRTTARLVRGGDPLRFPIAWFRGDTVESRAVSDWLVGPRLDTYYAIAITDARKARQLANHIDRLPMRCGTPSRPGLSGRELSGWLEKFATLAAQSARHIDWRAVELKDVY